MSPICHPEHPPGGVNAVRYHYWFCPDTYNANLKKMSELSRSSGKPLKLCLPWTMVETSVMEVIAVRYLLLIVLMLSGRALAGVYGSENWGEMYWGDNPVTAPTQAPTIASAVATEDQITITLDDFPVGTAADFHALRVDNAGVVSFILNLQPRHQHQSGIAISRF